VIDRETIEVTSEDQWLALRAHDITSTEISVLFGLSPYLGKLELWHRKKNNEVVKLPPNERMKWGSRLESAIALGAAEENGWKAEPRKSYTRIPSLRIGSSFDFQVQCPNRGVGLLEVKNVDGGTFAKHWVEHATGDIEAPEHIELQLQHQLEVADLNWGAIVALVGGNTLKTLIRKREPDVAQRIRSEVAAFWSSIDADQPPKADFAKDAEFIIKSLRATSHDNLVLAAPPGLETKLEQYMSLQQHATIIDGQIDALKAEILMEIGPASKVVSKYGTLSCGNTKPNPGKLITADMVGLHIGGRAGFRQFRFTPKAR